MEEEFIEDAFEGVPDSPRSPVQSSYGGSDAGDEVADTEMDNFELDENHNHMEESIHDMTEEQPTEQETGGNETENSNTVLVNGGTTTSKTAVETTEPENQTNAPEKRYKYKYPEAYPTPPGWDDEVWNKAYTAADSRIYNHAKKNHMVSKQKRAEGVTRIEALEWEKNKPAREAKKANKKNVTAPKQQATTSKSTNIGGTSTSLDSDIAKKTQKKKTKVNTPVGPSSFQQVNSSTAALLEESFLFDFSAHQTLADRIKGKSAASAAASSALSNESGTAIKRSDESLLLKKGSSSNAPPKRSASTSKGDVHMPLVRAPVAPKITAARTSSKSGTPVSAPNILQDFSDLEQFTDEEGEDDGMNQKFCICRGLLSTNMIQCERCTEWFHRRAACLGKEDVAIYKVHEHNIDNWYCPTCREKNPSLKNTFYPMCRREGCDNVADIKGETPSKYCSQKCGVKFFEEQIAKAHKGDNPSKGGALTQSEIGNVLGSVNSVSEFKSLGKTAPKLHAKGKIVSKQFLRNLVVGNNGKGKESDGKAYENKPDYKKRTAANGRSNGDENDEENDEEIKQENIYEDWEQKVERQMATMREVFNQKPYYPEGRPPSTEEFADLIQEALGNTTEAITAENYLDVDWSFLQRHGLCNPSEAEAIHDIQAQIKYDQFWIKNAGLKISFNRAVRQHSATILRALELDPKSHCGYLPIISKSESDFQKYSETLEGAHICETGRLEHVDPELDVEFQQELTDSICRQNNKKQRHTTHFSWADTHEKENIARRVQLTQDMRRQLVTLNDIMSIIHERILESNWKPIL